MVETQSAFLTVKFKLHNPSQRRRAMLVDAMRRAHLGYDKIPKAIRSDVDAIVAMEERKNRFEGYRQLQRRLQALTKPLPLGAGPKQAIIADALAQAKSYVELKREMTIPLIPQRRDSKSSRQISTALSMASPIRRLFLKRTSSATCWRNSPAPASRGH